MKYAGQTRSIHRTEINRTESGLTVDTQSQRHLDAKSDFSSPKGALNTCGMQQVNQRCTASLAQAAEASSPEAM